MSKPLTYDYVSSCIKKHHYKLLSDVYINSQTPLSIMCDNGHIYNVRFYNFKQGKRCPICNGGVRSNKTLFIDKAKKVHGNRYSYELVKYINSKSKVKITCSVHGVFEQTPTSHLSGHGCLVCSNQNVIGYASNNIPLYGTYEQQLTPYGIVCRRNPVDTNILDVRCVYCGKWCEPSLDSVCRKIKCINGGSGSGNIYCSDECKQQCPTYNQKKHPKGFKPSTSREVQPQLRKMVLERDDYTCQRCGSTDGLHCHHITGVELNPIESADTDNCITFCVKCHEWVHNQIGCTYHDYKRGECEK